MSRTTRKNGFIFMVAMCLGLVVTSARGGSMDFPAAPTSSNSAMDAFDYTADPGSNWSFAVFGDTRGDVIFTPSYPLINTPVVLAICSAITNDGALCALVPGDMVLGQTDGGTNTLDYQLALWTNAVSALGRAGIPYYAVRGNHEICSDDETNRPAHADWTKHIGRYMPTNGPAGELGMTYSIPCVNALFIGLDTYDGTNDTQNYHKINQTWLDAQLSANTQPHVFVFGHEPAFQVHFSSTCLSENLPERNRFWDSIGNANTRAYLTGHSHVYERCLASISNGPALRQIIVGTGGAPLEWLLNGEYSEPVGSGAMIGPEMNYTPANTFGYTLVRVSGNHVVMEYKSTTNLTTWTTNDVFAYTVAATPANVHASDGTYLDRVLVSWDAATDASGYEVWRGTNASGAGRARIGGTTTTSFSDGAAVPGVLYYYWVRAINADGAGLYSASDSGFLGIVGPLITANGLVGNVYLNIGDPVTIAVQMMNIDPYAGTPVDWWVIAFAYTGQWYYMNNLYQWTSFNGDLAACRPVYQGPLANLPSTPVLSGIMGSGTYSFWFAIDYPMNGVMEGNALLYNNVTVVGQ